MNNHILTASEFQFSSSFFDNELEKVLRECVGIYTEIINKKTTFPNDEEKIRNGFLVYLKEKPRAETKDFIHYNNSLIRKCL